MIDYNHYYILDFYPDVIGQPLLLIIKKGVQGKNSKKLKFPSIEQIVPIFREVTNEPEFMVDSMAKIDYEMPEKDREGTQLAAKRDSFSANQSVKQRNNTIEEEKISTQSPNKASRVQILDQSVVIESVTPED